MRPLRIERAWEARSGFALLLWVAVWLGIVAFFTSLSRPRDPVFTAWMCLPGVFMAYAAATRFFNRTVIDLTPQVLRLRHRPLPWPGGRRFAVRELAAVHTRVMQRAYRGGIVLVCRISLERTNGRVSTLLQGLEMSELEMTDIAERIAVQLGVPVCES